MSKAYKCDICGTYFSEEDFDNQDYRLQKWLSLNNTPSGGTYANVDICPLCYAALRDMIDRRKESKDERRH